MNNPHKNARTTIHNRVLIIERVLFEKQPVVKVAENFGISTRTVYKWLARYRERSLQGLNLPPAGL